MIQKKFNKKIKALIRRCLKNFDKNKLWWIMLLKETSYDDISSMDDSDKYNLYSFDHMQKQTKKFNGKKNVTNHSICNKGFLKHYSTTLSNWGKVFKIWSSFSRTNLMNWQSSTTALLFLFYLRTWAIWRICNTLNNSQ